MPDTITRVFVMHFLHVIQVCAVTANRDTFILKTKIAVKSLPLWGCLLLLYVVRLLSLFLLGSIVCLLSCATKSTAVTIFASLAGFGIPALLILLNERLSGVLFWVAPFSGNLLRKYPKAVSLGCIAACLAVTVVLHNLLIRKKG